MVLSVGKRRGLAQCATSTDVFAILALDHRGSLRRALNPDDPGAVSHETIVSLKQEIVAELAPHASAVLLDPVFGVAPAIASGALPGHVGLLTAVEQSGYAGSRTERYSEILPNWSVGKIRRLGASAVKLLIYYHPDAPNATEQEVLVSEVAEACIQYDLPLFLEPLSYSLDPEHKQLPSQEKREVVLETARRLTPMGVDVLKAEFPLSVAEDSAEEEWFTACQELTEASQVPWVLLSAGVDFDTYLRQVNAACRAGASGILAGRAIWQEAVELQGPARKEFLRTKAVKRMSRLQALCRALARPWTMAYAPGSVEEDWYGVYPGLP